MTSYVSCNRLRIRKRGGIVGRSGTALSASGYYSVVHGLGTPTIFGATMETHTVSTTAAFTRRCNVRLSGTVIRILVTSAGTGTACASVTAAVRWFAAE